MKNTVLLLLFLFSMTKSFSQAQEEMMRIHEEYPEISIPLTNKLYIIIYSKEHKPPVQKYLLEIKTLDEGGFFIEFGENNYQAPATPQKEESPEEIPQGYFTSMIALKKRKKK
jgi:hypothetical protein